MEIAVMAGPLRAFSFALVFGLIAAAFFMFVVPAGSSAAESALARGRYISIIGGCNDCHTAGYLRFEGKVPQKDWLMGDSLGWRGRWGTTYAPNLRLYMSKIREDDWVKVAKEMAPRPPMPWFNLKQMTDADLRALYRFIRSLGPVGKPAPDYLPPDKVPPPPFVQMP
jgi:mono/diheme cytochrome c family protein